MNYVRVDPRGRSPAEIVGSNPAGGHGCLSVVSVVCCQVEVSAKGSSLVQRCPTLCVRVCLCVCVCVTERNQTQK